jgi:uncharacterized protein
MDLRLRRETMNILMQPAPLPLGFLCLLGAMALAGVSVPASAQPAAPKRVLVVSTTEGFRHTSIEVGNEVIATLARESGEFTVDIINVASQSSEFRGEDGKPDRRKVTEANRRALAEKLSAEGLKAYDGVIFNNTTGDLPLPDREAFLEWIRSGKAFIGMHAATDTFPGFPAYIEMIGGQFRTHGPQVEVDILNQDQECPSCRHLSGSWTVFDEIYLFKNFDPTRVHRLLSLDQHPNDKTPGDYPIAWKRYHGEGRVFYTALGHREDIWDAEWKDAKGGRRNPPEVSQAYQRHILGGIRWALGLEEGAAAVRPE